MTAPRTRVKFAELPMRADDHARGFREYAVERHTGRVAASVGIVTRSPDGAWRGLLLGPGRAWTPNQRTRAAAVAPLLEVTGS